MLSCVLRGGPSRCQPAVSAGRHVSRKDRWQCHAPKSCCRRSLARHDLEQAGTARCNLTSLRPCGGCGELPAKAELLERRKGWPRKWRRSRHATSARQDITRSVSQRRAWTQARMQSLSPYGGLGGRGCPRKRSGWRGERAGHTSGGVLSGQPPQDGCAISKVFLPHSPPQKPQNSCS